MTDEQQVRDLIERWAAAVHDGAGAPDRNAGVKPMPLAGSTPASTAAIR